MARPLRIEEPGLWHHVMNRGVSRRAIFTSEEDYELFLALLGECRERWDLRVHSFCLMTNHYHLLVQDERGQLSRAIQHLNGVFTQRFNRRHRRDGSLFRGRFRSRVVQDETYSFEVARYIHNNPIAARLVRSARRYEWSSHRHYLSRAERPSWLEVETLLAPFGGDRPKGRRGFDEFVAERAPEELRKHVGATRWLPVLGDEAFLERWRERLRKRGVIAPEVPRASQIHATQPEEIIETALAVFELTREGLFATRRGVSNLPRSIALFACHQLCSAGNDELGELFGLTPGSVSAYASKTRVLVDEDRDYTKAWKRLRAELAKVVV